ncbi:arginine N-succinyltransferase [Paucibacter soli]|uniref:arginine N-succinyltransferase n=1 Tax=Paucibacter soli TaxID=3133433 RepID=UPI00309B832D
MSALRLRPWRPDSDAAVLVQWRNQTGARVEPALAEGEQWLLLADADDRPQACLRLRARLGLNLPRYSYHLGRAVHAAQELGLFQCQATLLLGNDHTGESELADLACAPELREPAAALGQLIEAALALIAGQREAYGERLLVELAGQRDAQGTSPFWRGLGAFFYPGDAAEAEARLGEAWRSHLAALLPRQTLYLSFLDEAAQAAAGQVGSAGQAALAALRAQGFAASSHLRIDDGGPIWELPLP